MPTKVSNFIYNRPYYTLSYIGLAPVPQMANNSSQFTATDTVTHGGPVPSYRRQIRLGLEATSNLVGWKNRYRNSPGHACHSVRDRTYVWGDLRYHNEAYGDLTYLGLISPDSVSSVEANSRAIVQWVNRAQSKQTSMLGGVFLGELGQTLRMIRSGAKGIREGLDSYLSDAVRLRNSNLATHQRLGRLSQLWLEYAFGWKPLINDVIDGAKALAENGSRGYSLDFLPVYSEASSKKIISEVTTDGGIGSITWKRTTIRENEAIVIYRGAVATFAYDQRYMNQANLGFTWDQFVPTVWELIPYSFLIDYFSNVGDVLKCWSFRGWNVRRIAKTEILITRERSWTHSPSFANLGSNYDVLQNFMSPSESVSEIRYVNRGALEAVPTPELRFEHPQLSSTKWLNIAALTDRHRSLTPFF